MNANEKMEFFQTIVELGLKEMEVKFPFATEAEMNFAKVFAGQILSLAYSMEVSVSNVLKDNFGIVLPNAMKEEVEKLIKDATDEEQRELSPKEVYRLFLDAYVKRTNIFHISQCHFIPEEGISAKVTITQGKETKTITTMGNGRLDAVSDAIKTYFGVEYELHNYEEHAISKGSGSKAAAFVSIVSGENVCWGVGIDEDIIKASIEALVSAANILLEKKGILEGREERIIHILNYIQAHYKTVTMDDLMNEFHLTMPYLSKYIKKQCGLTFQDVVREARMKRAKILLKETTQTVKNIAFASGYDNVEHFNRLFKKTYGITPIQYRGEDME